MKKPGHKHRTTITLFDLRTNAKEEIDIGELYGTELLKDLKQTEKELGVTFQICHIVEPEKFINRYFKEKGYKVLRGRGEKIPKEVFELLHTKYCLTHEHFGTGVPDFLIYNPSNIQDLFFVEVKAGEDGIRIAQLAWILSTTVPIKLAYVTRCVETNTGRYKDPDQEPSTKGYEDNRQFSFYCYENDRANFQYSFEKDNIRRYEAIKKREDELLVLEEGLKQGKTIEQINQEQKTNILKRLTLENEEYENSKRTRELLASPKSRI
jgi:hypothetical protein